ncbi:MAG: ParB/RepB/Spo0J family partition protein [Eubacteriales bacterium]|nr:ParB/RepB/Spo0J family partition protein [Eubacteriales bacterium]
MEQSRKPKITTLDELFGITESGAPSGAEYVQEIPISEISDFPDHPFKVRQDEAMLNMTESIRENGVRQPAIVRPMPPDGGYQMLSGHRRKAACMAIGKTTIPAVVREMSDDEAVICMVEANHQRENILPSERAFSYKMQLDAMKRQAGRPKNNSAQVALDFQGKQSRDILAEEVGVSKDQVRRFIRLTELVPPLLQMVDDKKIAFNPAVELSYLPQELQTELLCVIEANECTPSLSQAQRMKQAAQDGKLDRNGMELVMAEEKPQQNNITIKGDRLNKYFPKEATPREKEEMIIKALDYYCKVQERKRRERQLER